MKAALSRQHVDPTLGRYLGNIVNVALNIVLIVAILGYFGVETTSFAALVPRWVSRSAPRGRVAGKLRGGGVPHRTAPVQGGRLRARSGYRGHGEGDRAVRHDAAHARQHHRFRGQQQDLLDTIQNCSSVRLPPRGPHRPARPFGQRAGRGEAAEEALPKISNVRPVPPPDVEITDFNARGPVLR
jgi:small conductance mechanosensitive channel